jgi:hypothetical protein
MDTAATILMLLTSKAPALPNTLTNLGMSVIQSGSTHVHHARDGPDSLEISN